MERPQILKWANEATAIVRRANHEARGLKHEYVGTEHLLLGLVHEKSCTGARAIEACAIELPRVRKEALALVRIGPETSDTPPNTKLCKTPRAKRVIEYAQEAARRLGHNYLGSEHLLLGLIREQDGVAASVLMMLGMDLEKANQAVLDLVGNCDEANAAHAAESTEAESGLDPDAELAEEIEAAAAPPETEKEIRVSGLADVLEIIANEIEGETRERVALIRRLAQELRQ